MNFFTIHLPVPSSNNILTIKVGHTTNGRRFIDGDVSLGDILPNLLSETYALVKKGNYRKYIDGILYISFVKITPNVCLKSWKFRKIAKILQNLSK